MNIEISDVTRRFGRSPAVAGELTALAAVPVRHRTPRAAMAVTAFCAVGFAVGAYWPSRFAAPAAAFGGFLAMFLSFQTGFSHMSGWALILPPAPAPPGSRCA
jgi:hypothetical protein